MGTHSVIPPSSAHIWGSPEGCTGWPKMAQQFPEQEETEDTRNGNATHQVGEHLIRNLPCDIGWTASNGVVITQEMMESADLYARDVLNEIQKRPYCAWGTEVKIHVPRIHPKNYGTTDAYLYSPQEELLIIWDFKHGRRVVEAYMNWQGINYAAGLMDMLGIDGITDQTLKVEIRIVQPRAFHRDGPIRTWYTMGVDLRGPINMLRHKAEEALSEQATTRSGPHCQHCTARHACAAAVQGGMGLYEAVNRPVPDVLTPEELGTQLDIVKRAREQLEYLESGFEEQVKSSLRSGGRVPGWDLETGLGKRKWSKPHKEIFSFGNLLGVDLREKEKPVSPAQAEKKGVPAELLAAYVERSATGIKLVPENNNKAKQIFSRRKV